MQNPKVFGKTFPKDTPEIRLTRLEVNLLGAAQSGAPDKRLQTVLTAAHNFDTEYTASTAGSSNYANAWSTTDTSTNGGFWNGVKNFFFTIGYMTGYTPPIAPYGYNMPYGFSPNPYYSGYQNPRMNYPSGWNRYYRNNNGYYNSNYNIGSGCGVHILD